MTVQEMRQAAQNAVIRAQAIRNLITAENRSATDDENARFDAAMNEHDRYIADAAREERVAAATVTGAAPRAGAPNLDGPRSATTVHDRREDKPWESFGHMLMAVRAAAAPGMQTADMDPRLLRGTPSGMGEQLPSDGGYAVRPDFSDELIKRTYDTGILVGRCKSMPMAGNNLIINGIDETSRATGSRWGGIRAYWANEADAYTNSKPKLRQLKLALKKLTGLCYATDELLEDAPALGSLIMDGFSEEFGFQADDAIINGIGSDRPLGILQSAATVSVAKETGQAAATLVPQNLAKMRSRLWAKSRKNAVWLVNQDIGAELGLLKLPVGTGGQSVYLPANGLAGQPYDTLYGMPVIEIEQAATLGTVGDIMLVDLSQYIFVQKPMQTAGSIHVRFLYDEMTYRFTWRVDGQSAWHQPLTPKNGTATQSPFVTLATRS